jgi:[2Fe-2S] binding domain/Molybdopterin-binding domain of aldehyde dehydrogenase
MAGRAVTTIEGLADAAGEPLHAVRRALIAERASQCGYCTPGVALRAAALLAEHPDPGDEQIAAALDPCLCRCGCYPRIVRAVHRAAVARGEDDRGAEPAGTIHPELSRPARPWDLSAPGERDWFGVLGDGLVVVWPPSAAGTWPRSGGAWLHVAASGTVTAFTGKVDVGQDNQMALRLLVAEELAVDPAVVRLVQGDTDLCPYDVGTFGSRSMPDAGEALRRAAAGARQILIGLAATRLGGPHAYLHAEQGSVVGRLTGGRLPYTALLAGSRQVEVLSEEPPLTSPAEWTTAGRPLAAPPADEVAVVMMTHGPGTETGRVPVTVSARPPGSVTLWPLFHAYCSCQYCGQLAAADVVIDRARASLRARLGHTRAEPGARAGRADRPGAAPRPECR